MSSKSEDGEESWIKQLDGLCSNLNVDPAAAKKSKDSFLEIKRNYSLDGDLLHWMACAMYVACRTSVTPTVQSGTAVESNCVSLTRLLRLCNISLIQFFNKIKNWMEMAAMPNDFKERISHLEHKFAVSTVLFRNFQPIFQEMFSGLTNEPVKSNIKSKKYKMQPCSTNALFEFTWCLYISVKGEFQNSDDLVDMYHILLCCFDFVFANAYMARRIDLINPSFKGLPSNWLSDDFEVPEKAPCIISTLSELKSALPVEAATMKEYNWKPVIKTFFQKGILKGNDDYTGILDIVNFDANQKSLNNLYETYVLSVGEFDERIFLGEHANEQIGTKTKVSGEEISKVIASFGPQGRACPDTPLTGQRYLARRAEELTPVSEATNSLARLAAFLRHAKMQPSPHLYRLLTDCGVTKEEVDENIISPCHDWMEQFTWALREIKCSDEIIQLRCIMVTCLYYKVLEHNIKEEHRKKPQVSLRMLLSRQSYQLAIYACCTEVVLHAYGLQSLRFPRVLNMYRISAFHFYKVIELVVQAVVEKLSRDVIKHLNTVEEEVLQSLVWSSSSPLWEQLSHAAVPASTDVYAQDSTQYRRHNNPFQSPVSTAINRIVIPIVDQAKKKLFTDNIKPGQSLLVPPTPSTSQEPEVAEPLEPSPSTSNGITVTEISLIENQTPTSTPKKTNNSLILFFRKFYSLAVVRMNDLCDRLRLTSDELKRKIWTCLEYAIMHQTQLLRDRHLDQILMCTVYVVCKISNNTNNAVDKTFAEIMKCYRQRPLADNHVYRSVLITPATNESPAERSDLIRFYNKVYVQRMQDFALRFAGKQRDECSLSPLPAGRGSAAYSPAGQRVSERHQVYVKPLTTPPPHHLHLTYRFSRSPAKDLQAINTMVSCEVGGVKRSSSGSAETVAGDVLKRPRYTSATVAKRLQSLVSDRQAS